VRISAHRLNPAGSAPYRRATGQRARLQHPLGGHYVRLVVMLVAVAVLTAAAVLTVVAAIATFALVTVAFVVATVTLPVVTFTVLVKARATTIVPVITGQRQRPTSAKSQESGREERRQTRLQERSRS
jgi:uncharacterized metal-binding protein